MLLLFFVLFADLVFTHPLCSDTSTAVPQPGLSFCTIYSQDSCCNVERDLAIQTMVTNLGIEETNPCFTYVKNSTCTECDPWAAHLRGERETARTVPYLCNEYCEEFYDACADVDLQVAAPFNTAKISSTWTKQEFCETFGGDLGGYCFRGVPYDPGPVGEFDSTLGICVDLVIQSSGLSTSGYITMAHPPYPDNRIVISSRVGVLHIFQVEEEGPFTFLGVFMDIQSKVSTYGEGGVLGLAFHPDYADNGKFYVSYTCAPSQSDSCKWPCQGNSDCLYGGTCSGGFCNDVDLMSIIEEYTVSSNPNVADLSSARKILNVPQPGGNHNAGQILFGKDGYLYIFFGDGGGWGRQGSQDPSKHLGKILRIDVDSSTQPFGIPSDNPFVGVTGYLPEIYASGFRNPWRNSIDRVTGTIFVGDVGQDEREEVNILEKGANYGWRKYEGNFVFSPSDVHPAFDDVTFPILEYSHEQTDGDSACVIGGHIYRGPKDSCLYGTYIFGDETLMNKNAFLFARENQTSGEWVFQEGSWICGTPRCQSTTSLPRFASFGEDSFGNLYFLANDKVFQVIQMSKCPYLHCSFEPTGIYQTPETPGGSKKSEGTHLTSSLLIIIVSLFILFTK